MAKGDLIDSRILGSLLAYDNVYGFILDILNTHSCFRCKGSKLY